MRGRTTRAALVAATLLVAVEAADAGVGYYYAAPSVYYGPPVAVYYQPAPVAVVAPIAPAVPVYQPAYYYPPAPPAAVVYTPVYSAPTYTYVPAAPVTVRSRSYTTWFGRYQKDRYEIRTPYGRHKYKVTYDRWDGDIDYDYDFDD